MFSLNSKNSMVVKIFVIEPAAPSIRDQDATTVPARHR